MLSSPSQGPLKCFLVPVCNKIIKIWPQYEGVHFNTALQDLVLLDLTRGVIKIFEALHYQNIKHFNHAFPSV